MIHSYRELFGAILRITNSTELGTLSFNKQQEDLGTTNGHIEEIYSNGRFGIAPDRAVEYLADGKGTQLNFKTMGAAAAAFREMGRVDDACFEEIRKDVKVRGGGK